MKQSIESIKKAIETLENTIVDTKQEIEEFDKSEFESNWEESFDDMLDDTNPQVFNIYPSIIMKEIDPIMYSCELSNYVDSLEFEDFEQYNELTDILEEQESDLYDLECKLEELENNA